MANSLASKLLRNPSFALILAIVGAASMVYYHQGLFIPKSNAMLIARGLGSGYSFGNDFYQVWLTSRALFAQKQNPYSPDMTREIQIGLYGRPLDPNRPGDFVDLRVFPYPAFTDLLFWPASQFPFTVVRVLVPIVLLALTIASVMFWLNAMNWSLDWRWVTLITLLTLSSYSALEGLYAGQLGVLVAFLLAGAFAALKHQRFLLAGFLLSLTTIKPQVAFLPTIYLVCWASHDLRRRKSFLTGLFSTVFLLLMASLVALPNWIPSWLRTVWAYRHYTTPPLVADVLTSLLPNAIAAAATLVLTLFIIVLGLILAWQNRGVDFGSHRFWLILSVLLSITTVVILPGQAVYDHLILIPALFLLWRHRDQLRNAGRIPRVLLAATEIIFLWPWIAAFGLAIAHPFGGRIILDSPMLLALPIRTAASLPFAVLALLVWTWRLSRQRAIS